MTTAKQTLISVLAVTSFTTASCSPPSSEARQDKGEDRDSVAMYTELDANGLRAFLAGKEMSAADDRTSDPSEQRFFADGTWDATAVEIDIVRRKGRWEVRNDLQSRVLLCVTVSEQNGKQINDPPQYCYIIIVEAGQMNGKISSSDEPLSIVNVRFRDITNQK